MTQRILAAVDITDRSDGDALVWDETAGLHVYQALAGVSAPVSVNEFMNWPATEQADGLQPEWWEEQDGNATLTDVDVAGESITETWERCLKLVTTATDKYAYQRFTYADQPRIKSGKTVSLRVAVWSVSGAAARVNLTSSVGELGVSADTTAAAWTVLTVDGEVLDGTYVDVRFEVDNGTAYFVPLAFGIGATTTAELPPRGLRFRWRDSVIVKDLTGLGDEDTWTDIDCTSSTSNLAVIAVCSGIMFDNDSTDSYALNIRRNGSSDTKGNETERLRVLAEESNQVETEMTVLLDDGQIFEYLFDRTSGTGTLDFGGIWLNAWWEWS